KLAQSREAEQADASDRGGRQRPHADHRSALFLRVACAIEAFDLAFRPLASPNDCPYKGGHEGPPSSGAAHRVSIMAVPKRKTSRMKRGNRRSHDALSSPAYVEDKESGELRRPHHI